MLMVDWFMPQSRKGTVLVVMMIIPVFIYRAQMSPANLLGRSSQRVFHGLQKKWRSMVGRVDGLSVCLLRIDFITECMIWTVR